MTPDRVEDSARRRRMPPSPRRDAWERVTTVPLVCLGVAFVVVYSIYVLFDPQQDWVQPVIVAVLIIVWVVFLIDVVVRVALTPRGYRLHWVVRHPIDVFSVLLPLFRAFRVLELLRQVPYVNGRTATAVRTRVVIYAASYAVFFVYFIALVVLNAERDAPGATITSFGEAIWWACVTVATVGYGDAYPVTTAGRIYAVILMAGGIAIVGTASATVISVLNEQIAKARQHGLEGAEAARRAEAASKAAGEDAKSAAADAAAAAASADAVAREATALDGGEPPPVFSGTTPLEDPGRGAPEIVDDDRPPTTLKP